MKKPSERNAPFSGSKSMFFLLVFLAHALLTLFFHYWFHGIEKPERSVIAAACAALEIGGVIFFLFCFRPIFLSALFFCILYFSYPLIFLQTRAIRVSFPGVLYLIPFSIYFCTILPFPSARKRLTWMASGHLDHFSVVLILIVSLLSAASLIIWLAVAQPDIGAIASWFPDGGTALILLGGFGFAVTNSFAEEIIFRGILWEGISFLIGEKFLAIGIQALIFALWHYKGFPGGPAGSILVFLWGILLGILRARTGGMRAPLIAHFCSDMVIFFLLFFKICY